MNVQLKIYKYKLKQIQFWEKITRRKKQKLNIFYQVTHNYTKQISFSRINIVLYVLLYLYITSQLHCCKVSPHIPIKSIRTNCKLNSFIYIKYLVYESHLQI